MGWYLATVLGIFDPYCKSLTKNRNNNFFFYFEMEILVLNEIFSSMLQSVGFNHWNDHVLGWWEQKDDPNILFLKYEDMHKVSWLLNRYSDLNSDRLVHVVCFLI